MGGGRILEIKLLQPDFYQVQVEVGTFSLADQFLSQYHKAVAFNGEKFGSPGDSWYWLETFLIVTTGEMLASSEKSLGCC